ncbi:UDP-N-acetylhexosamine pyrophosphorylase-like protein 1 [Orchesella cincta]|uniref:UDP-N-acetylglucosamine diphosphorylase n=1 Tax=Orchesella cincta TaxID=48709 RepID=A0A1D2M0W7_ORCCI|nr:UDP-N-acetylhexosamine pyrophosphorylase-like protein 1 [Orchesella cincta]
MFHGNGGLYRALRDKGILNDMEMRGIEYIHVYCVDNILVKMADPVFIGYCYSKGADCCRESLSYRSVGVVCKVDGHYQVVEYSEITLKTAQKRNTDGRLAFSAGSICNHYLTTEFLRRVVEAFTFASHEPSNLFIVGDQKMSSSITLRKKRFHMWTATRSTRQARDAKWHQIGKVCFRCLPVCGKIRGLGSVEGAMEFSPLKNADGAEKDTPTTARHALYSLHQRFILAAGGRFIDESGTEIPLIPSQKSCMSYKAPVVVEISPLVSYAGEGLEQSVQNKEFQPPVTLIAPSEKAPSTPNPNLDSPLQIHVINSSISAQAKY